MYLLLANGDRVLVHKENCAFEQIENRPGVYIHREWDIHPYHYLTRGIDGHFIISEYKSMSGGPYDMAISTKHVVAIADAEKWEFEDVDRDIMEGIEEVKDFLF